MIKVLNNLRDKNLSHWLLPWLRDRLAHGLRRASQSDSSRPRHLLFAITDHFEPLHRNPTRQEAQARVAAWASGYPAMVENFTDADGLPPRHSFFFPGEEYEPEYLHGLANLCRRRLGEVELHLHHDGDTARQLRDKITLYVRQLASHGHLTRGPQGTPKYAFIHGNWALCNARPDGRMCGVDAELPLLFDTGCYADFTFPSVPSSTQPRVVNSIYWPTGDLARRRAFDVGEPARVGRTYHDRLLLIQGPLALATKPNSRVRPAIEDGSITANNPAHDERVRCWVRQGIHVAGRPDWIFVKIHMHGTQEAIRRSYLGAGGRRLHGFLKRAYNDGKRWRLHYVTAREMYNIAMAAMDGQSGNPHDYRNYVYAPPPIATAHDGLRRHAFGASRTS